MFDRTRVAIAEQILRQENRRRDVAGIRQPEQMATDGYPAFCTSALDDTAILLKLQAPLDRLLADAEKCRDLRVGTLHRTQLFQFHDVDLDLRAPHRYFSFLAVTKRCLQSVISTCQSTHPSSIPFTSTPLAANCASIAEISRRQRSIQARACSRSAFTSSKVRPSSSFALWPESLSHRITTTSTYFGSSSIP